MWNVWPAADLPLLSSDDSTDGNGASSLRSGGGGVSARASGDAVYEWLEGPNAERNGGSEARCAVCGDPGTCG